jgi:P-type Ca2+ transporter type 2C
MSSFSLVSHSEQAGDMIPADCVVCDLNVIKANESALTGESDDLKKSKGGDCFLLSSCLITEGEEVHAVVIGVGPHSQWGKIKANLVSEAVNTPLQDKLEEMAQQVVSCDLAPLTQIRSATLDLYAPLELSSPW